MKDQQQTELNRQLLDAVRDGNYEQVERLLAKGAETGVPYAATGFSRVSPAKAPSILAAAAGGNPEFVRQVLDAGADVNTVADGQTALNVAAGRGHLEVVKLLLERGAEVNPHEQPVSAALNTAMENGDVRAVELLRAAGAEFQTRAVAEESPLIRAIKENHPEVVRILLAAGAEVNPIGGHDIPLDAAVDSGNAELVRMLLEAGADVSDPFAFTHLLRNAMQHEQTEIVALIRAAFAKDSLEADALNIVPVERQRELQRQLIDAIRDPHCTPERVRELLAAGAEVNCPEAYYDKLQPIHAAVWAGRADLVRLLIDEGADICAETAIYTPRTALSIAARLGHIDIARMLFAADEDHRGLGIHGALCSAAFGGHADIIDLLLEEGAEVNCVSDEYLNGIPLALAVKTERPDIVRHLLAAGADANLRDDREETILGTAAGTGNIEIMRILADAGAEINPVLREECDYVRTPLMNAAYYGCPDAVRFLLERGATVNAATTWKHETPLICAANDGNVEVLRMLLEAGADVNAVSDEDTVLTAAAESRNTEAVRLLLAAGADINRIAEEFTPLILAARFDDPDMVRLLLDAGADPNIASKEYTPLTAAVSYDRPKIVKMLIDAGADVNAQMDGETALGVAVEHDCFHTIRLLRAHGAV